MDEQQARAIVAALGRGEAWQTGGGLWVVLMRRDDGAFVVLSEDAVGVYADRGALDRWHASTVIVLGS
jgi:hypothetical protein